MLRVRVCGGLEVEAKGRSLPDALVGGRQGRLVLAYLVCERHRSVRREELAELLWADRLPDSWSASLSAVISRLRRLLAEAGLDGAGAIVSTAGTYQLRLPPETVVDLDELEAAVEAAEAAAAAGDAAHAAEAAGTAEAIGARGFLKDDCDWVDAKRDVVRDLRVRAALAVSVAHLGAAAPARAVDAARDALALDESRESAYRQLMRALAAAGERAEALRVWERCRTTLVEELGVDPSPETEAVYLEVLGATAAPAPVTTALPSGVVTFLLTDIVESSALWDKAPDAMAVALERHDAIVADIVRSHGGTLLKSKLEGDATVSVFARASDGAAAALELHEAVEVEAWPEGAAPRVRMAMHTGEAFERGGDYFGPALNRAARLRSLAGPGDVLLSQAVTELVRDHLPTGVVLRDLGHRDLRGLSRGENVYALLRSSDAGDDDGAAVPEDLDELVRPPLPSALVSDAPFVGRGDELTTLVGLWERAGTGTPGAAFIGGEPGVGKSRLAGEIAAHAHAAGAIVLYGRCDEDLAAPLQPFIEALRTLVPALGPSRVGSVRGVDELARVVPELADLLPDRAPAVRADPDTERLALFDALTNVIATASTEAPVLLVLDDLHWAGKTTLSLLRHLLRGAREARLLVVGTYRDTELARTHPLAETLADLRRDTHATRVSLSGLAAEDIEAYLAALGIDDRALGRELAEVTSGNPFFLIEVLRHVEETGGTWSPGNLPEGVREATGRRLSRLSDATNRALSVAAVVGTTFDLALVEQAQGSDLVDEIAEACQAGLVVEEAGSVDRFRFAHALVRQVLLAELVTVKRVRLHKTIAELLETMPVGDDPDARLADLAYHWFECASVGDAGKAVDACRRAADGAMERLAYEEAGDLYGMSLQVLDDADDPSGGTRAALHLARCDALLTAGDVAGARIAIDALEGAAHGSERLAAWYTTYEGLLAVLAEPDRLTEIVQSIGAAAGAMRALGDLRGEARAHYVHASALERLGQIGAAERALDAALAAARSADDRRLADSILAEAPPAALWGPSSVTRASGRCLDVVRVLRINDGAPAVESVALRCQAVLEALRGRPDAARRMVGSARRTVERLGLVHRQLETEVMAGFIELLDDKAPEAERLLRIAYEGLRARGLGGEAAQAAAFLGRSLLLQHRVDEADEMAAEAEALAGSDLKAAIAWRGVRAEAAAHRGDAARALSLANEAVELASATDALLLVVDARLALATVLHATGDERGAEAEARRAVEACEAKGATALAARARGAAPGAAADITSTAATATAATPLPTPSCAAMDAALVWHAQFNRGALEEITATRNPDFRFADRRSLMTEEFGNDGGDGRDLLYLTRAYEGGSRFDPPQLIVARERVALVRCEVRAPGAEWSFLVVFGVDPESRMTDYVMFDVEDRNAANVELDRLTPETLEVDNTAWRTVRRHAAATNAKDMDDLLATLAPGFKRIDHRTGMAAERIGDPTDAHRVLFALDDWAREDSAVELNGEHRVLVYDVVWFRDGEVADAEVASLQLFEVDDDGLIVRQTAWEPTDLDAARAELHRTFAGDTTAWHAVRRFADAINAHDWDALTACMAPGFEIVDRRRSVTMPDGADPIDTYELMFSLDDWAIERTPIEAAGDRRILVHDVVWFRDGAVAEGEVEIVTVVDVDADGRVVRHQTFAAEDLEQARTALYAGAESLKVTTAWRAVRRFADAINAHDWEALVACVSPRFDGRDRRTGVAAPDSSDALDGYRLLFSLDDWAIERRLVETHGDRGVIVADVVWFRDGEVSEGEVESLKVYEVDEQGLLVRQVTLNPDDLDAARAELHSATSAVSTIATRTLWRADDASNAHDWEALVALISPHVEFFDRRGTVTVPDRTHLLEVYGALFTMDDWTIRRTVLGTHGEHRALVHDIVWFRSGEVNDGEVETFQVFDVDDAGQIVRLASFGDVESARAELHRDLEPNEARAELDDRDHATAGQPLTNQAWQCSERFVATYNAMNAEALTALHSLGYSYHDRRSTITAIDLYGEEAYEQFRFAMTMEDLHLERNLVTTRGEHLALVEERVSFRTGATGAAQIDCLTVFEIDDEGLVLRNISFEPTAMDEAMAELEARWQATREPDPVANAAWRAVLALEAASDAADWGAFTAVLHPDYEVVERNRRFAPAAAGSVATYQIMFSLDEWRLRHELITTRGDGLVLVRTWCWFRDGAAGEAEVAVLAIFEVGPDGRILRETGFELDQLDEATAALEARWQELEGREQLLEDPLAIPRNLAVRSVAKPGWVLLAAIGEHLCLHDAGDRLALHEVDDDGEVTAFLAFHSSDRRGAFDEVARRGFDRCGAPAPASRMVVAMNARDVPAIRSCLRDDCVIEDHRNLRVVPVETADEYVAAFTLFMELAQEYCVEVVRLDAAQPRGWVSLVRFRGTASDGGVFEMPTLACATCDETGRATLFALYEPADRDAALARLAEAAPG